MCFINQLRIHVLLLLGLGLRETVNEIALCDSVPSHAETRHFKKMPLIYKRI
jgi:hypothetical protein